jgi:hypothetical protein
MQNDPLNSSHNYFFLIYRNVFFQNAVAGSTEMNVVPNAHAIKITPTRVTMLLVIVHVLRYLKHSYRSSFLHN